MRRIARVFLLAAALVVFAFAAGSALAKAGGVAAIPLNTGQEVLQVRTGASGFFSYTIEGNQLCYTLEVRGLSGVPIGAHIHPGVRGVAGPVAVPLLTPDATTDTVSDCIVADPAGILTPAELAMIAANPEAFYVNVHTTLNPQGEIRGQLR